MRILLIAAMLLMLAPAAMAQDDACSEAEPCIWVVQVDEDGLSSVDELEGTVGDWYVFEFNNIDEVDHTVTYSEDQSTWEVASFSTVTSESFLLVEEGTFHLEDAPTGDTLPVTVTFDDVSDDGDGTGGGGRETEEDDVSQPFAPVVWILAGLAVVAMLARRR